MRSVTVAVIALVAAGGIATATGCAGKGDKGSGAGGRRDPGRDTFSQTGTGTGKAGDVEFGRGTGSHTGIGTMGGGAASGPTTGGSGAGGAAGAAGASQRDTDLNETGGSPGGSAYRSYTGSYYNNSRGTRPDTPSRGAVQ